MTNTKAALDRSFKRWQLATCLLGEGDRPGAARQLRAAIRTLDGHHSADDLRTDLEHLLAGVILGRTA